MQETPARFLGQEDPLRRDRLPTPVFSGFPRDSAGKGSACNMGDGFNPCVGRSPGGGKGYPLWCSRLENSMNCIVHEIAKSWTQLSDFYFHIQANQDLPIFSPSVFKDTAFQDDVLLEELSSLIANTNSYQLYPTSYSLKIFNLVEPCHYPRDINRVRGISPPISQMSRWSHRWD